jgi:hypothetical protein
VLTASRRPALFGIGALFFFCVLAVFLRGIRWDENYEFAQVILGQIQPPEGHPLVQYVRNAFSIQTYSSALILYLTGSAGILCGIRNLLFILATLMPVFLITMKVAAGDELSCSWKAVAGAGIAGLLMLYGLTLEFDGSYPQFLWPDMFSNGHVGTAYALLTVFLFISGHLTAAAFLLGLMPCIHIGQFPPVALFAGLCFLPKLPRREFRCLTKPTAAMIIGLSLCALFRLIQRPFLMSGPAGGAYADTGADATAIWKSFVALHDIHRAIPVGNVWLILAGTLLLTGLAAWVYRRAAQGAIWWWLFVYAGCIAIIVLPIMAVHSVLHEDTPPILLQWMPYRLLNHLPILFAAATCGILAQLAAGRALLAVSLACCLLHPLARFATGQTIYMRYLTPSAGLLFLLAGATFVVLLCETMGKSRPRMLVPLWGLLLAPFHAYGAACLIAGGYVQRVMSKLDCLSRLNWPLLIAAAMMLLYQQWSMRQMLPVPPYARQIGSYLAEKGEPNAVLLGPPEQLLLQAHTGHPVLADMALPFMITYLPRIGPAIEKMYNEIYGISFLPDAPPPLSSHMTGWQTWWPSLTDAQWRDLAKRYGFSYVAAPRNLTLNLPVALETPIVVLYAI